MYTKKAIRGSTALAQRHKPLSKCTKSALAHKHTPSLKPLANCPGFHQLKRCVANEKAARSISRSLRSFHKKEKKRVPYIHGFEIRPLAVQNTKESAQNVPFSRQNIRMRFFCSPPLPFQEATPSNAAPTGMGHVTPTRSVQISRLKLAWKVFPRRLSVGATIRTCSTTAAGCNA